MAVKKKASSTKKSLAKKASAKKTVKKKVAAKKTTAKKTATKKVVKKTVKKKTATKKAVAKKTVKKKVTAKKAVAKKTVKKKVTAKKAVTKKNVNKKTVAKKTAPKTTASTGGKAKPATKKTGVTKLVKTKQKTEQTIIAQKTQRKNKSTAPAKVTANLTFMGIPPYQEKAGEDYMNERQKAHIGKILSAWRQALMEEVDRTVMHMKDEASNFPDPSDRASQEEEFSLELRTRDRERKLIKKIEDSLDFLKDEDFGYCETCGIEIGIQRLEARPTATLCIDCKTLAEIKERQDTGG